jgi:hypothetical protein
MNKEQYGYVSKHPEFIPHVSIGYKPKEGLDLSEIELPNITFHTNKLIVKHLSEKFL